MNRLQRRLSQLDRLPPFIRHVARNWAIGKAIPFVGTAGIEVVELTPNRVVLALPNRPKVRNHIRQIHAAATALLAETATGLSLGLNIPDERLPLLKHMALDYTRRSEGRLTATATFPEGVDFTQPKGDVEIPVRVVDETGTEIVSTRYVWAWITKEPKR